MSEVIAMLEKVMAALHEASACLEADEPDVDVCNSHLARAAGSLQAAMVELNPLLKAMAVLFPGLNLSDEKQDRDDGSPVNQADDHLSGGWEKEKP